ncbi:Protein of unknown function [Cotesia congregata]|uniref:Uncharacterized protein n=1 Tax=Cotesia congregata TaxID=51543 RepID=A0A8J2ECG8_COTCN|nr:Protein of unknown function [Cotesia congregata]
MLTAKIMLIVNSTIMMRRAVAYRIRPLLPKHWTGFESGCILFCSAQEIQTSSNLKSVPPTVVAHDLSSLCDFKQIKKKKKIYKIYEKLMWKWSIFECSLNTHHDKMTIDENDVKP